MGNNHSQSNIKINFKQHLKIQKELVFGEEITKGVKPIKGRIKQSGQREPIVPYINHQAIQTRKKPQIHLNNDTIHNKNIKNPKFTHQTFNQNNQSLLIDNRVKSQYVNYPYSCIGLLQVQFQNKSIRGTGFLISSNWLLTCAHNLYDRNQKKSGLSASFTLGLHQKDEIVKENGVQYKMVLDVGQAIQISTWRLPQEYMDLKEDEEAWLYDFALVKLKNFYNLEQKYGYFGLDSTWAFRKAQNQPQANLIVAGYPNSVRWLNSKCKFLVQGKGPWTEILAHQKGKEKQSLLYINYKVFTSPGQSGSPIFYQSKEGQFFMIGVHTLGGDEQNSGILITPKARQTINEWIEEMKTIFDISNRNIGDEGVEQFMTNFTSISTKITELQLANNRIGPRGINLLMKTKWTNLRLLNLENNNIKLEGAKDLANPQHGWNSLEYLNLNNTMIGDNGCCILLANRSWAKLKELHLKRCSLTSRTVKEMVKHTWLSLQTLNIAINQLINPQDIATLFASNRQNTFPQIKNLIFTKNNKIGNEGLEVIAKAGFSLQSLYINGIGIDHNGMGILAKGKWYNLKKLHLDWNKLISIEGAKFITPNLFPNLTNINLDWTTLGSAGVKELMSQEWKTLKLLSLNHDYLGDTGLCDLRSYSTIESLVLQGNNITTEGAIAFSQKQQWANLMQLKLRSNHIKKNGFREIIAHLRNLNYLDINNNGLDAHEKRQLKQFSSQSNPNLHLEVDMAEEADYT